MSCEKVLPLGRETDGEFLRGVESSTCLLLPSPSPTPASGPAPATHHPLTDIDLLSGDDDAGSDKLQAEDVGADCSSSGSSTCVPLHQDPVSAQLINNISMLEYQSLAKTDLSAVVENADMKVNGSIAGSGRPLPKLVEWNWVVVRRVMVWLVVSGLVAMAAAVVAMLVTLPTSCNPRLPWYQGTVFYQVFTPSFENSNNDAYGDLRGLIKRLDYIEDLGAKAIRLNYIFEATDYPEHYKEVTNSTKISDRIGTISDFEDLVERVHKRNMSIVLDVPVTDFPENSNGVAVDPVAKTLSHWSSLGVDGFYLVGAEDFVDSQDFASRLDQWKRVIGDETIFIVSYDAFLKSVGRSRAALLAKTNLINVPLRFDGNAESVKRQIDEVLGGALFSDPRRPSVYWSVTSEGGGRAAGGAGAADAAALLLLALGLPGTVDLLYGDEIGLRGLAPAPAPAPPDELAALVAMRWREAAHADGGCAGGEPAWNCGVERPDWARATSVRRAVRLRAATPTLYASWTRDDGAWVGNAGTRPAPARALVVERWLPRRHSFVVLANPDAAALAADLSSAFYSGTVVAATDESRVGLHLYFNEIALRPHEAIVVRLDK